MRKLLVLVSLCLALCAAPAMAAVNLGLPPETSVNFDGNGVFAQTLPPTSDGLGPLPAAIGTGLFGVGTISGVAFTDTPGTPVWVPTDVGPNFEMTFVFWNAIVTSSQRTWTGTPGASTAFLTASYANGARLLLVQDFSKDFSSTFGPAAFDLVDGEYPTAYTLEDAGYDTDSAADAGSMWTVADDGGEEVFLDLLLDGNSSTLTWDPSAGFLNGSFKSLNVEILGGTGASQFTDLPGYDGGADAFVLNFSPAAGWFFGGDIDIQLTTVPEPATFIFLGTGLVSLIGYRLRRKMS